MAGDSQLAFFIGALYTIYVVGTLKNSYVSDTGSWNILKYTHRDLI